MPAREARRTALALSGIVAGPLFVRLLWPDLSPVSKLHGLDECEDGGFLVVVEAADGFQAQGEVAGGAALAGVEQERIRAGVQGNGEVAEDVHGGRGLAGFIAADVGDVHPRPGRLRPAG